MNERNGAYRKPQQPRESKNFANLTHDAIELAELQIKLLKLDTCEAGRNLRATLVLSAVGLVLLLGTLPVALIAVAESLVEFTELSRWEAFSLSAVGGLLLCVLLAAIGWWKLKRGLKGWQRSNEELSRNVAWLKSTLKSTAAGSRPASPEATPSPAESSAP